jgi:DNA topoisomerase IA
MASRSRVANGKDEDGKELFLANALPDKGAVDEVMAQLEKAKWRVRSVEKKERGSNPKAPYTTSKLQQDASGRLGFNVRRTMGVAQRLYEGVEIGSEGTVGLITYMRTDSTRVSPDAIARRASLSEEAWREVSAGKRECLQRRRMRRTRTKRFVRRMWRTRRSRFGSI